MKLILFLCLISTALSIPDNALSFMLNIKASTCDFNQNSLYFVLHCDSSLTIVQLKDSSGAFLPDPISSEWAFSDTCSTPRVVINNYSEVFFLRNNRLICWRFSNLSSYNQIFNVTFDHGFENSGFVLDSSYALVGFDNYCQILLVDTSATLSNPLILPAVTTLATSPILMQKGSTCEGNFGKDDTTYFFVNPISQMVEIRSSLSTVGIFYSISPKAQNLMCYYSTVTVNRNLLFFYCNNYQYLIFPSCLYVYSFHPMKLETVFCDPALVQFDAYTYQDSVMLLLYYDPNINNAVTSPILAYEVYQPYPGLPYSFQLAKNFTMSTPPVTYAFFADLAAMEATLSFVVVYATPATLNSSIFNFYYSPLCPERYTTYNPTQSTCTLCTGATASPGYVTDNCGRWSYSDSCTTYSQTNNITIANSSNWKPQNDTCQAQYWTEYVGFIPSCNSSTCSNLSQASCLNCLESNLSSSSSPNCLAQYSSKNCGNDENLLVPLITTGCVPNITNLTSNSFQVILNRSTTQDTTCSFYLAIASFSSYIGAIQDASSSNFQVGEQINFTRYNLLEPLQPTVDIVSNKLEFPAFSFGWGTQMEMNVTLVDQASSGSSQPLIFDIIYTDLYTFSLTEPLYCVQCLNYQIAGNKHGIYDAGSRRCFHPDDLVPVGPQQPVTTWDNCPNLNSTNNSFCTSIYNPDDNSYTLSFFSGVNSSICYISIDFGGIVDFEITYNESFFEQVNITAGEYVFAPFQPGPNGMQITQSQSLQVYMYTSNLPATREKDQSFVIQVTSTNTSFDISVSLIIILNITVISFVLFVCIFNFIKARIRRRLHIATNAYEIAKVKLYTKTRIEYKRSVVERLRKNGYTVVDGEVPILTAEDECSICLENIKLRAHRVFVCGRHFVHQTCFKEWYKTMIDEVRKDLCPTRCDSILISGCHAGPQGIELNKIPNDQGEAVEERKESEDTVPQIRDDLNISIKSLNDSSVMELIQKESLANRQDPSSEKVKAAVPGRSLAEIKRPELIVKDFKRLIQSASHLQDNLQRSANLSATANDTIGIDLEAPKKENENATSPNVLQNKPDLADAVLPGYISGGTPRMQSYNQINPDGQEEKSETIGNK